MCFSCAFFYAWEGVNGVIIKIGTARAGDILPSFQRLRRDVTVGTPVVMAEHAPALSEKYGPGGLRALATHSGKGNESPPPSGYSNSICSPPGLRKAAVESGGAF